MTPRQLEADVVQTQLRMINELLDDLAGVGDVTVERLASERPTTRHIVERVLSQLVGIAVGINSHIAAALVGRAPANYYESFTLAAKTGAISAELAAELAPSAGLRNVPVHEYSEIDLDRVARAVPAAQKGFREYVASVARFLAEGRNLSAAEREAGPSSWA